MKFSLVLYIFSIFILNFAFSVRIYDTGAYTRYIHNEGTLFGASISLYSYGAYNKYILVGAPLANITGAVISQTGNTLKCPILLSDAPHQVTEGCVSLDLNGIKEDNAQGPGAEGIMEQSEDKSNMRLGLTVMSNKESGRIITCGHLYKSVLSGNKYPVGLCHILDSINTTSVVVSPCRHTICIYANNPSPLTYGYCLSGFSAGFYSGGSEPIIGAPGAFNYIGVAFKGENANCYQGRTPTSGYDNFGMIGYKMTTGRIRDPNYEDLIASAPRANLLKGVLYIYSNTTQYALDGSLTTLFTKELNITGEYGHSIGYALLAVDVNNDGRDELLASEPLYWDKDKRLIDIGSVSVYTYNTAKNTLDLMMQLRAPIPIPYSRFGHDMTLLGDINKDGYPEIAISAPFGSDGGSIYIYTCSANGIDPTPLQIISANQLSSPIKGFGYSLSSAVDIDGNGYPDLVIGAPMNDSVYLLRSRRLINVNAKLLTNQLSVHVNSRNICNITLGGRVLSRVCFEMYLQLGFTGFPAPDWLIFNANFSMDNLKIELGLKPRAFFIENGIKSMNSTAMVNISKSENYTFTVVTFLEDLIFDIETPLEFSVSYELGLNTGPPDFFNDAAILSPANQKLENSLILVNSECGEDNVCHSDLRISGEYSIRDENNNITNTSNIIIAGLEQSILISLILDNVGEQALLPKLYLQLKQGFSFRRAISDAITHKSYNDPATPYLLILEFGDSISTGDTYDIDIIIDTTIALSQDPVQILNIFVNNSNLEIRPEDNEMTLTIPLVTRLSMQVYSTKNSMIAEYSLTNQINPDNIKPGTPISKIGPRSIHQYAITNIGPWNTQFDQAILTIHFPLGAINDNLYYLYLTSINTSNQIACEQTFVNRLNLSINAVQDSRRLRDTTQSTAMKSDVIKIDCREGLEACVSIRCHVQELDIGQTAYVTLEAYVYEPTLNIEGKGKVWKFTSYGDLEIVSRADQINIADKLAYVTLSLTPNIYVVINLDPPAWYIYVVPTVIGVLIIIIVILCLLYACGFFKIKSRGGHHRLAQPADNGEEMVEMEDQMTPTGVDEGNNIYGISEGKNIHGTSEENNINGTSEENNIHGTSEENNIHGTGEENVYETY